MSLRIATFNLENLDDGANVKPSLQERIAIMRPQLERVRADVLCLQEVHGQDDGSGSYTLAALDQLLAGTAYAGFDRAQTTKVGGGTYAVRNLITLSRHNISATHEIRDTSGPRPSYQFVTAIPPDTQADPLKWERPILHTEIDLPSGDTLHVFNVHLKSKNASSVAGQKEDRFKWKSPSAWAEGSFVSAMKRVGQALQLRLTIDELFDQSGQGSLIAACGDFNAESHEEPLRAICGNVEDTGNPAHSPRILIPCENSIAESRRFSLFHHGKGEMLDHILAGRALFQFFEGAEVHNERLPDESGAFRTDEQFPESDHAPVVAEFGL